LQNYLLISEDAEIRVDYQEKVYVQLKCDGYLSVWPLMHHQENIGIGMYQINIIFINNFTYFVILLELSDKKLYQALSGFSQP